MKIQRVGNSDILRMMEKIIHEKALEKSNEEYQKYKVAQQIMEKEQSLKEIEADIKKLKK